MDEHLVHGFHQRGYLPHLKHEGASYFVTFRLADSLPRQVLTQLEKDLAAMQFPEANSPSEESAARQRERRRRIERLLDQGSGSCCLRDAKMAALMHDAMLHFDGQRYELEAWVIMPNHVHAVLRPFPNWELSGILKSWKQFTSRRAKAMFGMQAERFWQPESYDHWVRDDADRARIIRYVHNNPVKAGLCALPEDWPWCSAAKK